MPAAPRSPLDGTHRLVVDGTNMLHRMGSGTGAAPASAIIGRLRGVVPGTIQIDLVFDGSGHGIHGRVAQQMFVRYSGRRQADDTILDLVSEAVMEAGGGPTAGARVLVVTDDHELRDRLSVKGARTASVYWLLSRLDVPILASASPGNRRRPGIGSGRPPGGGPGGASHDGPSGAPAEADERPGWKPGRGATSKTGPARKVARHKRHPRPGA